MKTNLKKTPSFLLALTSMFLSFTSCLPERDNPWDDKAKPDAWAPKSLEITINSENKVLLNWECDGSLLDGFKIDRRINEGIWQEEIFILNPDQILFIDSSIDISCNTIKRIDYKVFAFLNDKNSTKSEGYIDIPYNQWVKLSDFPSTSRIRATSFVINDIAYAGLGYESPDLADIWKYDYLNDSWSFLCNFPGGARSYSFAFVIGEKAYIGGGSYGKKDLWEYNPNQNSWLRKIDCPESTGFSGVGFSILNKGYIIVSGNLYEYNPLTDSWINKEPYPGGNNYPISFVFNGKAYVGIGDYSKDIFVYDPLSDTWSYQTTFPGNAYRLTTSITIDNIVYIVGGWANDNSCVKETWEYNITSNTWQRLDDFAYEGHSFISFAIEGKGYIGTGDASCGMVVPRSDMWKLYPLQK